MRGKLLKKKLTLPLMATAPAAEAAPAAKKAKRRAAFKPELAILAPPIPWIAAADANMLLSQVAERLQGSSKARLACGVNAATRSLEQDRALLLVIARPPVMRLVQHLPQLASLRRVPYVPLSVPSLSPALSHLSSCLAFVVKVGYMTSFFFFPHYTPS